MKANHRVEILIVEDSPTQAAELEHLLQERDFKVSIAPNAQKALSLAHRRKPALIISDILMPEMDGYALCREIKSDQKLKGIPVVLVTSLSSAQDVMKGLECGADNFIRKPYDRLYLLSRIEYILMNQELRRNQSMELGLEVSLGGRKHFITSERQQIVDLLISTYEEACQMNDELKRRHQELLRLNHLLNGLYSIALSLIGATSEQEVASRALARATELPGVRAGWIFLLKGDSDFQVAASCGLPSAPEACRVFEGNCLCCRAFFSGQLEEGTQMMECEFLRQWNGGEQGLRFHASFPLKIGGRKVGILNLAGSEREIFKDEDLQTFFGVGTQIALALERAHLVEHLEEKVEERTADLKYQATHDTLTGLPNRALLFDRLERAILAGQRENKPLALLVLDLNRFKEVNDTLGHQQGDLLLQQVGPRLKSVLRESDTVARLGGDEFVVLLPTADREGAVLTAAKMLKTLERPFAVGMLSLDIGASVGIALWPDYGEDASTLVQRADLAMYMAKQDGSGYMVYTPERDKTGAGRLVLMGDMKQAMDHNQFFLLYQPIINLRTENTVGVEALVRWKHPRMGIISPGQFIRLAEQTGLIKPLTLWILGTAFRQCQDWCRSGLDMAVSVNLSARMLRDPLFPDQVAQLLQTTGMPANRLWLEITEKMITEDVAPVMETLARLGQMEINLSLDDFGTGYLSLSHLKRLPIHEIKIDGSFIMEIEEAYEGAVIVQSTIDLAHHLGLRVVAEGVETQKTWMRLASMGCDTAQGYYRSRPMQAAEFPVWMSGSSGRG